VELKDLNREILNGYHGKEHILLNLKQNEICRFLIEDGNRKSYQLALYLRI
jgi:hypothetical protein